MYVYLDACGLQHRDITECVKPMFARVLELRECEDDIVQRDANNIVEMLGSNLCHLMEKDQLRGYLEELIEDTNISTISMRRTVTCSIQRT